MSLLKSISFTNVDFNNLQGTPSPQSIENFRNFTNIQCPQEMRQFIPQTANYIFNYIASKATSNQFRAIHFNMLISDNCSNPELTILTTFVINLAYIKFKNQMFTDVTQAIMSCAVWVIDKRINFITISDQRLSSAVGNKINEITAAATDYVTEADAVNNLLANTFMGGRVSADNFNGNSGSFSGNNFSANQQISGFGNTGQPQAFSFNNQQNVFSNNQQNNNQISGFGISAPINNRDVSSVFPKVNTNNESNTRTNFLNNGIFEETVKTKAIVNKDLEVVQPTKVVKVATVNKKLDYFNQDGSINMSVLKETDLPWKTSIYQKHTTAYNPRLFKSFNLLLPKECDKGNKDYVLTTLTKVENMDRSSHALPASEQFLKNIVPKVVAKQNINTREEYKEASLNKSTDYLKEIRELYSEQDYGKHLDDFRTMGYIVLSDNVTSVAEAISYARLTSMIYMPSEYGSYQLEFNLATQIPVYNSDLSEIVKLMNYKTFQSLTSKIRGVIEDEHAPQTLRTTMVQLNSYLAKKFIDYIRFYLSITDYSFSDSFIDDAMAMIDDIALSYGESYKEIILSSQEKFIETNLTFGDATQNNISDKVKTSGDVFTDQDSIVAMLPIITPCLLTCTEFLNSEYNIKTTERVGAMFNKETTTAGLFNLVKESTENNSSVGLDAKIKRFFIATLDNVIYETNIGLSKKAAPLLIMKLD